MPQRRPGALANKPEMAGGMDAAVVNRFKRQHDVISSKWVSPATYDASSRLDVEGSTNPAQSSQSGSSWTPSALIVEGEHRTIETIGTN
jgi:hypothetical protein